MIGVALELAACHGIPESGQYRDRREARASPGWREAAMICTQDADHKDPAIAEPGWDTTFCWRSRWRRRRGIPGPFTRRRRVAGILRSVCHGLRYTQHNRTLKQLLDTGLIGRAHH